MTSGLESRTPHFGLRDFLSYLVPGSIVLLALALLLGLTASEVAAWGNIGGSIAALLTAYFVGQLVYPMTYLFRSSFKPDGFDPPGERSLFELGRDAMRYDPAYYAAVIFRDRSLARFTLAMVCPPQALAWSMNLMAYSEPSISRA